MSQNQERPSSSNITWIVGCFSAVAVIIAAIIGLGAPFAERIADFYFPTLTPIPNSNSPTDVIIPNQVPNNVLPNTQPALQPTLAQVPTQSSGNSEQSSGPLREHKTTPIVGSDVLAQGTYSDGMAPYSEQWLWDNNHFNIQRVRLEENPDGCAVAFMNADKIWFGSSVRTNLTINDVVVGTINGATGKHGYIFNVNIHIGDKVCVSYFEPSGFQIVFGPDLYYHYDSYCYRGNC